MGAAFAFIGEMFPEKEATEETQHMAEMFKRRLSECVDKGEDGKVRMTIALPDESVLDNLAKTLARMAGS